MFCDRCGAEAVAGQKFCGSCGKPLGVAVVPAAAPEGRIARHLQTLAILWFVASSLNLIGAAVLFILSNTLFRMVGPVEGWTMPMGFMHGLFRMLAMFLLVKALAGFAAGWGLLERETWARPLALILGFLSLLHIPLGTALGIYTIWVLMPAGGDDEYRRLARAA